MAVSSTPRIVTFLADASIAKGKAVKYSATAGYVTVGSANTDHCFGIAQNEATASGQLLEVAIQGGGGKALAGEAIATAGLPLVSHTDGTLVKANASGDRVVAISAEAASSADIFAVEVVQFDALGAE